MAMLLGVPNPVNRHQRDQTCRSARSSFAMPCMRGRKILDTEAGGAGPVSVVRFLRVEKEPFVPAANRTVAGRGDQKDSSGGPVNGLRDTVRLTLSPRPDLPTSAPATAPDDPTCPIHTD